MAAIFTSLRRKSFPLFFELLPLRYFHSPSFLCTASAHRTASPDPHFMVEYLMNSCGFSAAEAAKASKAVAHLQSIEKPDAVLSFMRSQGFDSAHFMVEYLMNSYGLSAAQAAKASKAVAHLKSIEKLDAVLSFMRSQGFGSAHLRKLITVVPKFLCFNVKTNLAPKLQSLRSIGFSESDLVDVLVAHPDIIFHNFSRYLLPKLKMWEGIFGSRELLIKHFRSKSWFLRSSNEKVASNMRFLRDECGIPKERVYLLLRMNPSFITRKIDSLRALAVRIEELGVPRKSGMFLRTLIVLTMVSKKKYEAKLNLMRTIGWSDSEFISAIRKAPSFLELSQESLRKKVDFFLKKVGCSSSYLAERPTVLTYSLEKRIIPRFRVMELLKSEGFCQPQPSTFLKISDKEFRERYVLGHKDKFPNCTVFCELLPDEKGDDSSHLHVEYTKKVSQS